jgi:Protein of unknown function (DUF2505)
MMSAMRVTHEVRYDAPVTAVRAMLTDPAFREHATWTQGASSVHVNVEDGAVRIAMESLPRHVPAYARPLVGETVHVVQAEDWTGDAADFSVTTARVPAGLHGRRALVADGDGCRDTFDGEAHARIPLLGGRIEKLMAERLKEGWDVEHGVGVAWLTARSGGDR